MVPRSSPPPTLLVVATAFDAVERVRRALGGEFVLARCATVAEASARLTRDSRLGAEEAGTGDGRIAGLLLEPVDALGVPTASLVRLARAVRGSSPPVLALMRRSAPWCPGAVALLEAQPTVVLVAEELDLDSVQRALSTRLRRAEFVHAVWGELEPDVPEGLRPLVRVALARAGEPLSVQAIADALGLHRKTLWSRCRRHGVASVQALMTWCRLLAVEHALRTCTRPVDAIAEELAFASPTALRNAVRRHLRTTPTALRQEAGSRLACAEFRAWMRARRGTPPVVTLSDVA